MFKRIALSLVAVIIFSAVSGQTTRPSGPETVLPLVRTVCKTQQVPYKEQDEKEPEVVSLLGKKLYAAPGEGEELAKLQANLEEALRAVEADPDSLEAIIAWGRALAGLWRYHEAIEVYSKGIKAHPGEAMLYRHRGHRYISIREFGKAASDMAQAAALNDKDFDIWYHLGLAHYLLGDFDKARAAYESCLKVSAGGDSKIALSNWL